MNQINRLGIFVFYDREGVVDEYVLGLLEDLSKHLSRLVVVCNGELAETEKDKLNMYADIVSVRENKGFDAMAFRHGMLECIGREEMDGYDELLLCNDTFYGPLYPFASVFEKMEGMDLDFWGLSSVGEMADDECPGKMFPPYIQFFFMVFRKKVLQSEEFWHYWEQLDTTEWCFSKLYREYEFFYTKFLEDLGMKWDCFVPKDRKTSGIPTFSENYELVTKYQYPILKRKAFLRKNPDKQTGDDIRKAYEYIRENALYDVNLIWDNLLRLYSKTEIWEAMHLDYVIDTKQGSRHLADGTEVAGQSEFVCMDFSTELEKESSGAQCLFDREVFEEFIRPIFENNERLGTLVIPRDICAERFGHIEDGIDETQCLGMWQRKDGGFKSYYTARLLTVEMMQLRLHNIEYMMKEVYAHFSQKGELSTYTGIFRQDLIAFADRCNEVFVYGAGDYGNEAVSFMRENGTDVIGYVVSDGQPLQSEKNGKEVMYLSEFVDKYPASDDRGIVVALMPKHRDLVRRDLYQNGYRNLFFLR